MAVVLFTTQMQRLVIATIDFDMLRIIVLFGMIRVFWKGEHRLITLNGIDKLVLAYIFMSILVGTLLWGTMSVFIQRCGFAWSMLGSYFLCRILIIDPEDFAIAIKGLLIMAIPIAAFMILEQFTRHNLFGVMGGVPEITRIRDGRLRSQGSFNHPILAGTFGGSLLPLVAAYWHAFKDKRLVIMGVAAATAITITSNSSGPYCTYLAALTGLCFWPLRNQMRKVFWGGVSALAVLHFVIMNGPVWALIGRFSIVSGSTATHRVRIIDKTIEYFHEWWLLGTYGSGHWGWGLEDVTNMYARVCISDGFFGFLLFTAIIALSFKTIGWAVRSVKDGSGEQKFFWAIGACLFSHAVSFLGVSYFGTMFFWWVLVLAMTSALREKLLAEKGTESAFMHFSGFGLPGAHP
jgi:hypothetical protein